MQRIFDTVIEIIYWILLFLAPALTGGFVVLVIYSYNVRNGWVAIIVLFIGVISGVVLAERIRRKYGCANYMGRILATPDVGPRDDGKESPSKITGQELQNFADHYSPADFEKIRFNWNGKYGQEFDDPNYDFRMKLCQFLVPQIDKANIELIRDLYSETTRSSKATFVIYQNIHIFAQELLRRDWKKYLIDYMQGGTYGMDSYLGIGRIEIGKEIAQKILDYVTEKLEPTEDEHEKKLLNFFLPRFQWLATK